MAARLTLRVLDAIRGVLGRTRVLEERLLCQACVDVEDDHALAYTEV